MDAQEGHSQAMISNRKKSKVTKEMLEKFRKENVGLVLQNTHRGTGLIEKVMQKHNVSRERALELIEAFGG